MNKKETLASENTQNNKPTAEEAAFMVFNDWLETETLQPGKGTILNCGLVNLALYGTANILGDEGILVEVFEGSYNEIHPVDSWATEKDGLYHIQWNEGETALDRFREWLILTIDRMYGWNE